MASASKSWRTLGEGRELAAGSEVGNWLTAGLSADGMDLPDIPSNKGCSKGVKCEYPGAPQT